MSRERGPCLCGDPYCPSCGRAQGTYPEKIEPDADEAYEQARQEAVDKEPLP